MFLLLLIILIRIINKMILYQKTKLPACPPAERESDSVDVLRIEAEGWYGKPLPRLIPQSILAHRAGCRPLRLRPKRSPVKNVIYVTGYRAGRRTAAAPVLQHDDNDHILSVLAAV